MSLITELKRRHVFRVAGIYAVVGWLLMQLSNHFEESLSLPGWFDTFVTLIVLMGFPIAIVLAWAFDLTPQGVKRTEPVEETGSSPALVRKGPNYLLLFGLIVLVGALAWQLSKPTSESAETARVVATDEKSIAVLPFIPLSANENDAYFGKGISEELLNALTKFPELKVAARTSAFSFEGLKVDLREVGQKLGVAHVLEGSVRSAGDKVRVTAQLIRADDGFHLWSETYDRNMSDLFVVQDEIVAAISRTLQIQLGVGVGAIRVTGKQVDPGAYQNYLRGLELWGTRSDPKNRRDAIKAFQLVTAQDPDFADGWAAYGVSLVYSVPKVSGLTYEEHATEAKRASERALELDPENVRALAGLAVSLIQFDFDIKQATGLLERAVAIAPNSSLVHYASAWLYELRGELTRANQFYERAISLDPLNAVLKRVRTLHYNAVLGDYAGVIEAQTDCTVCTTDDLLIFELAKFMAARRGGTDEEVRQAAASYRAMLLQLTRQNYKVSLDFDMEMFLGHTDPAFIDWLLGGARPPDDSLSWMYDLSCAVCDITLTTALAAVGEYDAAFELLELSTKTHHDFLFYIIDPIGRDAWPDDFRRDPRFHAFWQRQGMPELAAILKANNKTGGLPLPLDGEN